MTGTSLQARITGSVCRDPRATAGDTWGHSTGKAPLCLVPPWLPVPKGHPRLGICASTAPLSQQGAFLSRCSWRDGHRAGPRSHQCVPSPGWSLPHSPVLQLLSCSASPSFSPSACSPSLLTPAPPRTPFPTAGRECWTGPIPTFPSEPGPGCCHCQPQAQVPAEPSAGHQL